MIASRYPRAGDNGVFSATTPGKAGAWSIDAPILPAEPWIQNARCAETDPEIFFPTGPTERATRICDGCTVEQQCLAYALKHDEQWGVWGGTSAQERRNIKHPRPRRIEHRSRWTAREDVIITRLVEAGWSNARIGSSIDRAVSSVRAHRIRLGLPTRVPGHPTWGAR